jgi:hypothetical protein
MIGSSSGVKQIASTHRHQHIAPIMSSRITVTDKGIVFKGRTFDFETCEDTGWAFMSKVSCSAPRRLEGGESMLICGIQSLNAGDALVIAQHLNTFKRLRRLDLVRCSRRGVVFQ